RHQQGVGRGCCGAAEATGPGWSAVDAGTARCPAATL
ncbi:uncharacterized protein METZ01_LOCUS75474, partial [marine metagenome]